MSPAVIDASVFLEWLFPEMYSGQAAALIADLLRPGWRMWAPIVVRSEVLHVIRRRMRSDRLPLARARGLLDYFLSLPITVIEEPEIYRRALDLTEAYSLTGYDAQYVALAQTLGCNLWVADERLVRAIGGRLRFVKPVGAYAGDPGA